jgi:hypothetical protein
MAFTLLSDIQPAQALVGWSPSLPPPIVTQLVARFQTPGEAAISLAVVQALAVAGRLVIKPESSTI